MKIFKKQIPVRHILYVVLGWLHATMLCVPLYALVLNFVSEGMTKDVILQNILRGFLILAPIALSWFAIKCLRRIFFYILASIGITVLTGFLFDSVLMAVVALFICFMRLYGRLHGESYSLFDHAGYAGLAVFAVPFLCSVFTDRADLIFQPVSLVFAAVYFVLCLTQRGIRRIDDYIDVNAAMQNMPARRIVRITCALLAAAAVFCTAVLLPPLLTNVLIAVLGGGLALAGVPNLTLTGMGVMTLGGIASFLQLSRSFVMPISQVTQQISSIIMAMAGASRIFSLLDAESEKDEGYVTLVNAEKKNGVLTETDKHTGLWAWKHPHKDGTVTYTELTGHVELEDVDFGYTPEKTVLHDITLYAEPGQKVAFVGATGAGKTTITNLINRFYDISDGKIRYDGINITKIKKPDLRRSLGVVLQDVNLFTGTVMENIRYGKLDATDEECIAAAKLANADGFIRMLPQGYDTVLSGDGSGLSQGQRQLISIARAAVADPPVMILDEATSSIDTRTEAIVQSGMDALMKGRTVFVIAHRLSTVQNSDVIMVLDHGHIIERGSHRDLIAQKGTYYRLYTGAFELE